MRLLHQDRVNRAVTLRYGTGCLCQDTVDGIITLRHNRQEITLRHQDTNGCDCYIRTQQTGNYSQTQDRTFMLGHNSWECYTGHSGQEITVRHRTGPLCQDTVDENVTLEHSRQEIILRHRTGPLCQDTVNENVTLGHNRQDVSLRYQDTIVVTVTVDRKLQ